MNKVDEISVLLDKSYTKKHRVHTQKEHDDVLEAAASGMSIPEIHQLTGVPKTTILRWLRNPTKIIGYSDEIRTKALSEARTGKTVTEISILLHVNKKTIIKWIRESKIPYVFGRHMRSHKRIEASSSRAVPASPTVPDTAHPRMTLSDFVDLLQELITGYKNLKSENIRIEEQLRSKLHQQEKAYSDLQRLLGSAIAQINQNREPR